MSRISGMTHVSQQFPWTNDGEHDSITNPLEWETQAELCMPLSNLAIDVPSVRTVPSCNPSSGSQTFPSQPIEQDYLKQRLHKKRQTEKQAINRGLRKGIKRTTRRINKLREMDKDQDREPKRIDAFHPLPQFEFLAINEQLAAKTLSGLDGFGQMDLSKEEVADDDPPEKPLASFMSVNASSDEQSGTGWESELNEFTHMDSLSASAPDTTLDMPMNSLPSSDSDDFCLEDLRKAAAAMLARIRETRLDVTKPPENEATTVEQTFLNLSIQEASSRHPVNESQPTANREQFPMDNSPCTSFLCPIQEPHNEGPYHHNGVLGDQNHPQ